LRNILFFTPLFDINVFFDLKIWLVRRLDGDFICDKFDFSWDHIRLMLNFVHVLLIQIVFIGVVVLGRVLEIFQMIAFSGKRSENSHLIQLIINNVLIKFF